MHMRMRMAHYGGCKCAWPRMRMTDAHGPPRCPALQVFLGVRLALDGAFSAADLTSFASRARLGGALLAT